MKILNIVATRYHILQLKYTKRSPRPHSWIKGSLLLREGRKGRSEGKGGEKRGKNHSGTFLHFES